MEIMYPGKEFSPFTTLSAGIGATDTNIPVEDISAFPPAPNLATIGTDENAETVLYAAIAGNMLSGCERGKEGVARTWTSGSIIGRNFTAEDYRRLVANMTTNADAIAATNALLTTPEPGEFMTTKIVDGEKVAIARAVTGTDVKLNSTPLDVVINETMKPSYVINRFLQVSQRGTTFAAPNGYTLDRMHCAGAGTVTAVAGGGMRVTGTVTLRYILEDADLKILQGKTVTLGYNIDGNIHTSTFTLTSATAATITLTDCTLYWIDLQPGSFFIPPFPRPYGLELTLCKRYYQRLQLSFSSGVGAWNGAYITFPGVDYTGMRTTPTPTKISHFATTPSFAEIGTGESLDSYIDINTLTVSTSGTRMISLNIPATFDMSYRHVFINASLLIGLDAEMY